MPLLDEALHAGVSLVAGFPKRSEARAIVQGALPHAVA